MNGKEQFDLAVLQNGIVVLSVPQNFKLEPFWEFMLANFKVTYFTYTWGTRTIIEILHGYDDIKNFALAVAYQPCFIGCYLRWQEFQN